MPQSELFISLEKAWPEGPVDAVFLTTYTFNAPYFESQLLPLLRNRGAHPIVVFVDRAAGYQTALASLPGLRLAGRDYYLINVDKTPYAFHPKVHLFCGKNEACLVGSGNLTPSGCGQNLEVFDLLDPMVDGVAVTQVRGFFRELLQKPYVGINPSEREYFLNILSQTHDPSPSGETQFFHSLEKPLYGLFESVLLEDKIRNALFAAPFHDASHKTTFNLIKKLGKPNFEIAANTDSPPPPPRSGIPGKLLDPKKRPLHAKFLHADGELSSILVVGSANFTESAWKGHNVEAIVVRQALEPNTFNKWRKAVPFKREKWPVPEEKTTTSEPLLAFLPLLWATISEGSQELIVSLEWTGVDIQFTLESADELMEVNLIDRGDNLWTGQIPFIPKRSIILRAAADGYRDTFLLIEQPEHLKVSKRMDRIKAAIQKLESDTTDENSKLDILSSLGDIFAALHKAVISKIRIQKDIELKKGKPKEKIEDTAEAKDRSIEEVEDLFNWMPFRYSLLSRRSNSVSKLIDAVANWKKKKPDEKQVWHPKLLELTADRNMSPQSPPNDPTLTEGKHQEEKPEDDNSRIVDYALKLIGQSEKIIFELKDIDLDVSVFVYEEILRLSSALALNNPNSRALILERQIELLKSAWAINEWPELTKGWFLENLANRFPNTKWAVACLLQCVDFLQLDDFRYNHIFDLAHRILNGINTYRQTGNIHKKTVEINHPALQALREIEDESLQNAIMDHKTKGEEAQELLDPLWNLEMIGSRYLMLRKKRKQLEERFQYIGETVKSYSHRSKTYKSAVEAQGKLKTEIEVIDEDMRKVSMRYWKARSIAESLPSPKILRGTAASPKPSNLLDFWKNLKIKIHMGIPRRIFPYYKNKACACCNMSLPTRIIQAFEDPRNVVECIMCGATLVSRPREEMLDG